MRISVSHPTTIIGIFFIFSQHSPPTIATSSSASSLSSSSSSSHLSSNADSSRYLLSDQQKAQSVRARRSPPGESWKESGRRLSFKSLCDEHCQCTSGRRAASSPANSSLTSSSSSSSSSNSKRHEQKYEMTELKPPVQCKNGVSQVMDGCGCCLVCARQRGDSCDEIHPCDALKQLYCDAILSSRNGNLIESGICKPKHGEPCLIDGRSYKDGEQFQLNCSLSCSCQNGQYACASLCPQEERPPSTEHCGQAKLLSIAGRCCKEWVCPHPPHHTNDEYSTSYGMASIEDSEYSLSGDKFRTHSNDASRKESCAKDDSGWSSCSATCGTGWSIHMKSDENCKTVVERMMCYMRPCPPDEAQINPNASLIWSQCLEGPAMITLSIEGCDSKSEVNTTICSSCYPPNFNSNLHQYREVFSAFPVKKRCCKSGQTRAIWVEMICSNGSTMEIKFRQIRTCKCRDDFCGF